MAKLSYECDLSQYPEGTSLAQRIEMARRAIKFHATDAPIPDDLMRSLADGEDVRLVVQIRPQRKRNGR
jgi:hypothetical protein